MTAWNHKYKEGCMKYYGHEHQFNKDNKGCCPGHDTIYHPWGTRTSRNRSNLKRYPKKVERAHVKRRLKSIIKTGGGE